MSRTAARQDRVGLAAILAAYWIAVGGLVLVSLARTDFRWVYPLDDTYVHMAMAKHAALNGVWGVTVEQFTSASSSPLWTGILALTYLVFGVSDWAPLLLNILIGTGVVVSVHRLLHGLGWSSPTVALASMALLFLGTLPTLTVLGMEHTLHVLVTLWFVLLGVALAGRDDRVREWWPVAVLAAVLTLTRYEGTFAVACVAAALLVAGRWRAGLANTAAGAASILIYGLWSQTQGGFFLPNSVLLKGVAPSMTLGGLLQTALLWPGLTSLVAHPHLAFLVVAVLGLAVMTEVGEATAPHRPSELAIVFIGCTVLHMQFARVGWFYRYETYLVVLGLVTVTVLLSRVDWAAARIVQTSIVSSVTVMFLVGLLTFPLVRRAANAIRQTPAAVSNIFEQQYQAGLFLDRFYRGRRVAVNDVGAMAYLADVKLLDVWGLASRDTADLKRRGEYSTDALERLAARDGVDIAIIYPTWLGEYGGVPASWQKVGEWRVSNNVVLGENGMSFYAITSSARDALIDNLIAYADRLPSTVIQEGSYRAGR